MKDSEISVTKETNTCSVENEKADDTVDNNLPKMAFIQTTLSSAFQHVDRRCQHIDTILKDISLSWLPYVDKKMSCEARRIQELVIQVSISGYKFIHERQLEYSQSTIETCFKVP